MHVCAHTRTLFHCLYFENILFFLCVFPLCCYVLFSLCIFNISDAFVLLVSVLHFSGCLHMCRASSFVHPFTYWFNFCVVMHIVLLGLDFGVFWGFALLCFPHKLAHFRPFLMFADSCRLAFLGLRFFCRFCFFCVLSQGFGTLSSVFRFLFVRANGL